MDFDIKQASQDVVSDPQGRFWNTKWNLHPEVLSQYRLPDRVTFTDSTIREGEEAPHVVYSMEDKLRIARFLDEVGVQEVDCGFASINQGHLEFLAALNREGLQIRKSAIARVDLSNYRKGIDAIIDAGADIVLCGLYPTPIPGYDWSDYCKRVTEAVAHCKKSGVFSAFWITCTRWNEQYTLDIYQAAIDGGADRIKTAGGGVLTVAAYKRLVTLLKKRAGNVEIGVHVHNNYGTATACTLAAVEAGASNVETSVNGLADGAGLAPFEEVAMALTVMYGMDLGIKTEKIMALSQLVQDISGVKVQAHKPLVGESVFIETPDTHLESIIRARLKGEKSRGFISPETIGQKVSLLFGPSALGGKTIELKAKEMGIDLTEAQTEAVIGSIRKELAHVKALSENRVEEIILKITQPKSDGSR